MSIFFACAVLTGRLAAYARKQTEAVQRHAYEQNILYELTSTLNQANEADKVYSTLQQVLSKIALVKNVDILPFSEQTLTSAIDNHLYLLLRVDERIYGVLHIAFDGLPSPSLVQLATACAVQATIALQRIELAERVRQGREFEEADRLKTALLRAVSHDFRTPLTIIKTSVSNLLTFQRTLPEDERVDMLKGIETETDHLNKMVGNLLDLSRLQAGAMQINCDQNSLEEVAGDVAARVWQLTRQERIQSHFPEDMPLVCFDYGLILQALSNLVENSLRYEPAETKVEIRGSVVNAEARIAVCNHGPAIPSEERALIMEPFYHGKGGHTGLGLAIAKGIIEAHGGKIWIEDSPNGGAIFMFSLPLSEMMKGSQLDYENTRRGR